MTRDMHEMQKSDYPRFVLELIVDFVIMYLVMYTMINTIDNFHFNLNNAYMTLMMVAPMAIVMTVAMPSMFRSRRVNTFIIAAGVSIFLLSFIGMRTQAGIGDKEFIRAMVPHHSGAILMCREAAISDMELMDLCQQIIKSQQEEIDTMEKILARL